MLQEVTNEIVNGGKQLAEYLGVKVLIIIVVIGTILLLLKPSEEGDNDFYEKNKGKIGSIFLIIFLILIYNHWL